MFVTLPNAFGEAADNMAIDAALLETVPPHGAFFRHYAWTSPCFSFGYAQRFREVAAAAPIPCQLVRRQTGGGIVDHRSDWTYALILARESAVSDMPATEFYEQVHRILADVLRQLGVLSELAPCQKSCSQPLEASQSPGPESPADCFRQPSTHDVLPPSGRKIAGAAMRRSRQGLLLQGSLDRLALPGEFDFQDLRKRFTRALADWLELAPEQPDDLRPFFDQARIRSERERFASAQWNQRR